MRKYYCDGCGEELRYDIIYGRLRIENEQLSTMGEETIDWDLCFTCRLYFKRLLAPLKGNIKHEENKK